MKVNFVNTPHQGPETLNPQVIDGEIKHWTVRSEMLYKGENLQGFLIRKKRYWDSKGVVAFYFYDAQPVDGVESIIIRYYLETEN